MESVTPLAAVLALALLCESLTEYLFADLLSVLNIGRKYLRHVSALVGISLCLIYGLDAISPLLQMSPKLSPLGQVLSGLALGRGANYVHDLYTRLARLREDG